jgi:hypothetical protein
MMKSIPSTRQLATDSTLGTPIRNGTRRVCEDAICISFLAKKGQHSIFASFGGYESIQRNFRRRHGIKVFRVVICFVLCIIMTKETQAVVCPERTWRMMKSIPSTRQLATDSTPGTPIRNGTRRVCEDAICISFLAKGQHSIFASFGGYESIERNFRRRRGIKVFRTVICFVLCIIIAKETQAVVCPERTWRMMKSIPSTRQLATDSTPGTMSCNGTRRACEDAICIPFRGGIDGDSGIEYIRGPDSVIIG